MEYGTVPGVAKRLSRIVQGSVMLREDEAERGLALLDAVYAEGCTAIDTARHYGNGSEAVVGRWLKERGPALADTVAIIGKGAHHSPERNRVTPEDIAADLEESLRLLGVEAIDVYLLHRDDPSVAVGPIVEALDGHKRAGKILAYGGSNWSHGRIAEANAYAAAHGLTPFVASSPNLSLAEQAEAPWPGCISIGGPGGAEARTWYEREGMAIFSWSSLAGGFFSGGFDRENDGALPAEAAERARRSYGTDANYERLQRVRELAAERGLAVPQIALAWVLTQPLNLFALVGCETGEEFAANAAAGEVRLSPEEIAWLDLRQEAR